jgi:hypothetical protein
LASDTAIFDFEVDYQKCNVEVLFDVGLYLCRQWMEWDNHTYGLGLAGLKESMGISHEDGYASVDMYLREVEASIKPRTKEKLKTLTFQQVLERYPSRSDSHKSVIVTTSRTPRSQGVPRIPGL